MKKTKYKLTTEYLGIVDNKQVEEEIITILKNQFIENKTKELNNQIQDSNQ